MILQMIEAGSLVALRAELRQTLAAMPTWHAFFARLWLAMPFLLLTERSLPDYGVILIGFAFLARCIIERDWGWTRQPWVRLCMAICALGVVAALAGPATAETLERALLWLRFPIFLAASQVWFGRHTALRDAQFCLLGLAAFIMCAILTLELALNPGAERLSWPYGNIMSGSFLAKPSLLFICACTALIVTRSRHGLLLGVPLVLWSLTMVVQSGDRINTLITATAIITSIASLIISLRPSRAALMRGVAVGLAVLMVLAIALSARERSVARFGDDFGRDMPFGWSNGRITINAETPYWRVFRLGIQMFSERFWLGYGPDALRHVCDDLPPSDLPGTKWCEAAHPHNYYLQMASDTGIIGPFLLLGLAAALIYNGWRARRAYPTLAPAYAALIVPLALLFPLQATGSFFTQWHNLFLWYALSMSQIHWQGWRKQ